MINVLGQELSLPPSLHFLGTPFGSFVVTGIAWLFIGLGVYFILTHGLSWITRRIPGDIDDIILATIRKPALILITIFGTLNDTEVLQLPADFVASFERILNTVLAFIIMFLVLRLIWDVLGYYGEYYAQQTETRIDDVLVPIVQLVGPIVTVFATLLVVLPHWGINVPTVLAGAGIVSLVLGLSIQEPLTNIFSGVSLLAEPPFGIGDLIVLPDGKLCQVVKIGRRATTLYHVYEHSTISIPNKQLAAFTITNVTMPTVDIRVSIDVALSLSADIQVIREELISLAKAHPNVIVTNIGHDKLPIMRRQAHKTRAYEKAILKLEKEHELNNTLEMLDIQLHDLIRLVRVYKEHHFTHHELRKLQDWTPVLQALVDSVIEVVQAWLNIDDPSMLEDEKESQQALWATYNRRLQSKWKNLAQMLNNPSVDHEMRLDHETDKFRQWLRTSYKARAEEWKDPRITFRNFGSTEYVLRLEFYVDDIRLEHFCRKDRVYAEITEQIHTLIARDKHEVMSAHEIPALVEEGDRLQFSESVA